MNEATLAELAAKDNDELYALLGASLMGDGIGLGPGYRSGDRQFGREWFENKRQDLQDRICDHRAVQPLLGNTSSDAFIDVVTVGEIVQIALKGSELDAIQVGLVAVLVARTGLHLFCSGRPT
jgi:hypothetical protein